MDLYYVQVPLLPYLVGWPLVGALVCMLFPKGWENAAKRWALFCSYNVSLTSLGVWMSFDSSTPKFQFVETFDWLPSSHVTFTLGVDGISLFFVILTTFLVPLCLLVGWESVQTNVQGYCAAFLVLESAVLAVFTTLDLVLFYVFFESVLLPMFAIIGIWGSRERKIRASYQLFLYTLIGSVPMLLAILLLLSQTGTGDYQVLLATELSEARQIVLWLAFFCSFAVKVPMIPVHIWLPEAHVEAPTAGSIILAGVLLKLGTYGFLRFSVPLFPEATLYFTPLIQTLSVIGVVYASLTTLRQGDMKKIIAYSSVAHMGFVTLGVFSGNLQGVEGSVLLMLSHGLASSALFVCVGILYDRHKTRLVGYYGGCVHTMPVFCTLFLICTMANLSLPGTSSFVAEMLILVGAFQAHVLSTVLACSGMVLGAAYSLWLYNRVCFGLAKPMYLPAMADVNRRECMILLPLVAGMIWMGVCPNVFLEPMHVSVANVLQHGQV